MTELWYDVCGALYWLRDRVMFRRRPIERAWVVVVTSEFLRDQTREVANTTGQPQVFWEIRGMFRGSPAADRAAARLSGITSHVDRTSVAHYLIAEVRPIDNGVISWAEQDYLHPRPGSVGP